MSTYQYFEEELNLVRIHVQRYNKNVNESSVWLFVATLGCWGVNQQHLQVAALVFTFLIFIHRVLRGLDSYKPFTTRLEQQTSEIKDSDLDDESKKTLTCNIIKFKKKRLNLWRLINEVPAYSLSIAFLSASAAYTFVCWRYGYA